MTARLTVLVDKSISDAFHRAGDPAQLVKMLRKAVAKRSRPTLAAVLERTPFRSGLLQQSLGITMRQDGSNGEVYATVGVRDNVTVMVGGRKMLASSLRPGRAAKIAAHRGLDTATNRTAFKYIYGIEQGVKRGGGIARKAGGAHMLTGGLAQTRQGYIDGVGADVLAFIRANKDP